MSTFSVSEAMNVIFIGFHCLQFNQKFMNEISDNYRTKLSNKIIEQNYRKLIRFQIDRVTLKEKSCSLRISVQSYLIMQVQIKTKSRLRKSYKGEEV